MFARLVLPFIISVAVVMAAACAGGASPAPASKTDLQIEVWPQGTDKGGSQSWTLRCDPAGGTLPNADAACRALDALKDPFAPVPKDAMCTQIYGGPAVARVTGTFRDQRIDTTFRRTDGCQVDRWEKHRFLFPVDVSHWQG